jgi:hypothetical protein
MDCKCLYTLNLFNTKDFGVYKVDLKDQNVKYNKHGQQSYEVDVS